MTTTIAVTRNTPQRFDGFLASCMLEVAPGVYVAPRMKKGTRERVWETLLEWSEFVPDDGGVVLFWRQRNSPSDLGMKLLGWPKKDLTDHEGQWLTQQSLTDADDLEELKNLVEQKVAEPSERDPTPESF